MVVSDSDIGVSEPAQDVRGMSVVDRTGRPLGTVADLLVDGEERHARFLVLTAGSFVGSGSHDLIVPIDAITAIEDHVIHLDRTREDIASAPPFDRDLAGDAGYCAGIYGWYGFAPFWQPGYAYPLERFTGPRA